MVHTEKHNKWGGVCNQNRKTEEGGKYAQKRSSTFLSRVEKERNGASTVLIHCSSSVPGCRCFFFWIVAAENTREYECSHELEKRTTVVLI